MAKRRFCPITGMIQSSPSLSTDQVPEWTALADKIGAMGLETFTEATGATEAVRCFLGFSDNQPVHNRRSTGHKAG